MRVQADLLVPAPCGPQSRRASEDISTSFEYILPRWEDVQRLVGMLQRCYAVCLGDVSRLLEVCKAWEKGRPAEERLVRILVCPPALNKPHIFVLQGGEGSRRRVREGSDVSRSRLRGGRGEQ